MFRFAHISDLHLPPPCIPRVTALSCKQVLSYLSWKIKRQHLHQRQVVEAGLHALRDFAPDHICLTGDLVNLALPEEIDQAAEWLRALETLGATCTLVPGNHDALVRQAMTHFPTVWAPWMGANGSPATFPYVVRRGPAAFIGLSSALPTPPGAAWGKVHPHQVEALEPLLRQTAAEKRFRVLLLHHPPAPDQESPRRRLRHSKALLDLLRQQGADLILHGHVEKATQNTLPGPNGDIPVYGAGSFSLCRDPRARDPRANTGHFYGFCLERTGSEFQLSRQHFQYQPSHHAFTPMYRD